MRPPESRAIVWLIGLTVAAWAVVAFLGLDSAVAVSAGFIPARFSGIELTNALPAWITPLSATMVHAGIIHLGFNMLMLGYCGRFVQYALGPRALLVIYGVSAYAAAGLHYAVDPEGMAPMVGASGAISGLVGAYALLFSRRRVSGRFSEWLHVLWLAAGWVFIQMLIGLASIGAHLSIAIAAHIGGFLAGLLLARPLLRWRYRNG